jgi:hypothetical protein
MDEKEPLMINARELGARLCEKLNLDTDKVTGITIMAKADDSHARVLVEMIGDETLSDFEWNDAQIEFSRASNYRLVNRTIANTFLNRENLAQYGIFFILTEFAKCEFLPCPYCSAENKGDEHAADCLWKRAFIARQRFLESADVVTFLQEELEAYGIECAIVVKEAELE